MSITHGQVADRWAAQATDGPQRLSMDGGNVYAEGNRIYSYGSHFEIARIVPDANGKIKYWLVNGDSYGPSTTTHQWKVRAAITYANEGIDAPVLIVPHTALRSAGIDLNSIEPLEIRPDRYVPVKRTAYSFDKWDSLEAGPDGIETKYIGNDIDAAVTYANGVYTWQGRDHVLGDSVFTGKVAGVKQRRKFLSSFDYQEAQPLYFLCELPRCRAETVEAAYQALKPEAVARAVDAGVEVTRQGDIFAIPTSLTTREVTARAKKREKRTDNGGMMLLETNHVATDMAVLDDGEVYARGCLYHDPGQRARDHARRKMADGKTWHRILKNTVPVRPVEQTQFHYGYGRVVVGTVRETQAWTISGQVD